MPIPFIGETLAEIGRAITSAAGRFRGSPADAEPSIVTDKKSLIRRQLDEAKKYSAEIGDWTTIKSGKWLWFIIERSFKNYWEHASAEYFYAKFPNLDADQIAEKLITVAAKNASILGGIIGATVSTDEIVGLLTGFEGGVGLPANIAIAGASLSAEAIQLVRIQLQLVANLGKLYGAPLDPDDPEDILTILAFALGGGAATAAGTAGMQVGGKAAGFGAKKLFAKDLLATLKKIASKVGVKILQRSIVKYTVPLVSIAIGSGWNYLATRSVGQISIRHFKQRVAAFLAVAEPIAVEMYGRSFVSLNKSEQDEVRRRIYRSNGEGT
jgi:uncharacterized protein (DUF697 family)